MNPIQPPLRNRKKDLGLSLIDCSALSLIGTAAELRSVRAASLLSLTEGSLVLVYIPDMTKEDVVDPLAST